MARPIKEGLSYFPIDVDMFDDPKLLFVAERFDVKGEIVTLKLLCWIYRNGYSCEWNDETAMIFAKKNFSSIKAQLCQDIVSELLKRGFFNEDLFKSFGVLTSRAIQERWQNVITNSKRKSELIPELNLLLQEETPPIREETHPKQELSTQSKVKERKVNKSKPYKAPPNFQEFKDYALEKLPDVDLENLKLKYQSWIENGWKTGKNQSLKNWKSTLLNTLPYLKKEKSSAKKENAGILLQRKHGLA